MLAEEVLAPKKILVLYGDKVDQTFWAKNTQNDPSIQITYMDLKTFMESDIQPQSKYDQVIINAHGADEKYTRFRLRNNHKVSLDEGKLVKTKEVVLRIIDKKYLKNPGSVFTSSCFSGRFMVDLQKDVKLKALLAEQNITALTGVGSKYESLWGRDQDLGISRELLSNNPNAILEYAKRNFPDTAIVNNDGEVIKIGSPKIKKNQNGEFFIVRKISTLNKSANSWKARRETSEVPIGDLDQKFISEAFGNLINKTASGRHYIGGNITKKTNEAIKQIELWIEAKSNILDETFGGYGLPPLHVAIIGSNQIASKRIAEALLAKGIDIDKKDNLGRTALHFAAKNGLLEMFEFLLSKGADINKEDNFGQTIMSYAAMSGREEMIDMVLKKGFSINMKNAFGQSAIHIATINGDIKALEILLKKGANINEKDNFGNTALHLAVLGGNKEITELLIKKGANINEKGRFGNTPLHLAAFNNQKELLGILLSKGAKTNEVNDSNFRVSNQEVTNGQVVIEKMLKHIPEFFAAIENNNLPEVKSLLAKHSDAICSACVNEALGNVKKSDPAIEALLKSIHKLQIFIGKIDQLKDQIHVECYSAENGKLRPVLVANDGCSDVSKLLRGAGQSPSAKTLSKIIIDSNQPNQESHRLKMNKSFEELSKDLPSTSPALSLKIKSYIGLMSDSVRNISR